MASAKINNKKYEVPQIGFGQMEHLESEGYDIIAMLTKRQAFAPASAFISLVLDCDRDEANRIAEQHVLGGGDITVLASEFIKALENSAFFMKMLGVESPTTAAKKTSEAKPE